MVLRQIRAFLTHNAPIRRGWRCLVPATRGRTVNGQPADYSVPQNGAKLTPGIRVAAEYRWAHPDATWAEVAEAAGCHRNTLERWRDTEAWEAAMRTAGAERVTTLAPSAVAGLLKSWQRGNAAGAVEVLKALGLLKSPPVVAAQGHAHDIDAEIEELLRLTRGKP